MRAALLIVMVWTAAASAQSVRTTFTTTTKPGAYAPQNCVSVWVEDKAGAFVKTIGRWSGAGGPAGDRTIHLIAWRAKAGTADVDAVSGATRLNHTVPLMAQWDLKNKTGALVPDGTYTIRMEMTEDNSTMATQNLQGSFTFVKGPNAQQQMGLSNNGFVNVAIDYIPNASACNNGIVEAGETCDPPGSCPTSCPAPTDVCMENVLAGSAATCTAECVLTPIADCDTAMDIDGGCSATRDVGKLLAFALVLLLLCSRRRR